MADLVSSQLGLSEKDFKKLGIFDAVIGVDTLLFMDPFLLKRTKIPEFANSRKKIETYFNQIIKLLLASRKPGDLAWRTALSKLTFRELRGISIGYSVSSSNGSAIGPVLARRLLATANEIIDMGIKDPEIFELIGLFEDDFGADRLSDMTIAIIKDDIFKFTERMSKSLGVRNLVSVKSNGVTYKLPISASKNEVVLLLPKRLLRDLPVAYTWEGIDHVVSTNMELRMRLNKLIGSGWKNKIKKKELRAFIFGKSEYIQSLLATYRISKSEAYDFDHDPSGQVSWYNVGRKYAVENPLPITEHKISDLDQLQNVVSKIVEQFKRNVEINGLKEHLYVKQGIYLKRRHERYSQLLFYSTADTYCEANNVDLSREPNAGSGPVDFKISKSYSERVLVEIKLSSNPNLVKGYQNQLPAYEASERTQRSFYVVLQVTKSKHNIEALKHIYDKAIKEKSPTPKLVIIDATLRPTASKR